MIRSMTAFGRQKTIVNGREITVEIKSVNNRYFDCSVRISRAYSYLEERVKPYLASRGISRGKVDVSISIASLSSDQFCVSVNDGYARAYIDALKTLRDQYGLKDDISVMTVARNSDVFTLRAEETDVERDWQEVLSVLSPAVDQFLSDRAREGESLMRDILHKLDRIRTLTDEIGKRSSESITGYRARLEERLRATLAEHSIVTEESRILTECAIFSDRVAVDEELVRLRTHMDAFAKLATAEEPVGRKLDFLLQEMNREINTTGSKCSDAAIAQLVVEVKNELEKIREQVQNIE